MNIAYDREEVLSCGDRLPERGLYCDRCKVYIPQFADLSLEDANRIRQLIGQKQHILAMQELRSLTGCSAIWAKIWVTHSGQPTPLFSSSSCPFCRKPLRTALAKQCPHCYRSWHNVTS